MNRVIDVNEKTLNIRRRRALEGKRYNVAFYGGWFMFDARTNATVSHTTFEQALDGAEAANKGERNFH